MQDAHGLWYRPWAGDLGVLKEVRKNYAELPVRLGDTCLDVGAHIGAATRLLLEKGAGRVVAVEPDPGSFGVLQRNTEGLNVERIAAAVAERAGFVDLYILPGRRSMNNTYRPSRNRTAITVEAVTLEALLGTYQPDVVKCDAEFVEHRLSELRSLPAKVRALQLEIHLRYGSPAETATLRRSGGELIDAIEAQGFRPIRKKELSARNQHLTAGDDRFGPYATSIDCTWSR